MSVAPNVPVLMYHRIGVRPVGTTVPGHYVTVKALRSHLRLLTRLRFGWWRATELADWLSGGKAPSGRRAVLTFDDGYQSFAELAVPALRAVGATAAVFAVADLVGEHNVWDAREGDVTEPLMDASTLREVVGQGMEVGSHTLTHARLSSAGDQLEAEVRESRERLAGIVDRPVDLFCYPYGDAPEAARAAVDAAGYRIAFATTKGSATAETDRLRVPRINVRSDTNAAVLLYKLWRVGALG